MVVIEVIDANEELLVYEYPEFVGDPEKLQDLVNFVQRCSGPVGLPSVVFNVVSEPSEAPRTLVTSQRAYQISDDVQDISAILAMMSTVITIVTAFAGTSFMFKTSLVVLVLSVLTMAISGWVMFELDLRS